jgi:hypothetical protein
MTAPSPTVTPERMMTLLPIQTSLPIVTSPPVVKKSLTFEALGKSPVEWGNG